MNSNSGNIKRCKEILRRVNDKNKDIAIQATSHLLKMGILGVLAMYSHQCLVVVMSNDMFQKLLTSGSILLQQRYNMEMIKLKKSTKYQILFNILQLNLIIIVLTNVISIVLLFFFTAIKFNICFINQYNYIVIYLFIFKSKIRHLKICTKIFFSEKY